jgi:polar amino acid transport system substrate-binding protein
VQADFAGRIRVLPRTFERQDYVLGLPAGSPLREPINRALLDRIHRSEWTRRLEGYLGD